MQTSTHPSATLSPVVIGAGDDAAYRTVSILSIVSLVLGLAAPLALIAPLLFAIPIAGAAVALLALRRIAASDGALVGRTAAVIGLTLSIASISAAFTRTALTQEILSRQARAAALEWIALLQTGDAEKAFQLTTTNRQGPPPKPPAGTPDAETGPETSPLETFRADPVVRLLLDQAKTASVQYVRDSAFDPASGGVVRIQQLFDVGVAADSGGASTTPVEIVLQRTSGFNGAPSQWLVSTYRIDDVTSNPDDHDHSSDHVP